MAEVKHSSFRLPPVVKARLAEMAEDDGVKLTPFLIRLVTEEWRRRQKAGTLPAPRAEHPPQKPRRKG